MSKKPIIAIDGHSGCGKSTLAKAVAQKANFLYIDSGAMYRAVTWFLLEKSVDISDEQAVSTALADLDITFVQTENGAHVAVNGQDVEPFIRTMTVSNAVSPVAALKAVREKLVFLQQKTGENGGVVMDGRDIGTVVFPDAKLKIFLTANVDTRVERRVKELESKGKSVSFDEVKKNLESRDHIDSTRAISPLRKANDAITIDNSELTRGEQLEAVLKLLSLV